MLSQTKKLSKKVKHFLYLPVCDSKEIALIIRFKVRNNTRMKLGTTNFFLRKIYIYLFIPIIYSFTIFLFTKLETMWNSGKLTIFFLMYIYFILFIYLLTISSDNPSRLNCPCSHYPHHTSMSWEYRGH